MNREEIIKNIQKDMRSMRSGSLEGITTSPGAATGSDEERPRFSPQPADDELFMPWRKAKAVMDDSPDFDEERIDIISTNGATGEHYTKAMCGASLDACMLNPCDGCMTLEEEEMLAEEKHTCDRCGGEWWSPMNIECPCRDERSDGSTAKYYELPIGALELQDLISYRNMNGQDAEIFRAIYRKGLASHSDALRDARKVLFYAQAEVERIERYGA